jgi:hypothetical protein
LLPFLLSLLFVSFFLTPFLSIFIYSPFSLFLSRHPLLFADATWKQQATGQSLHVQIHPALDRGRLTYQHR